MLQADSILIGSVDKADETYTVKARIIDVESGKTTRSTEQRHKGKIDNVLVSVIPDMGRKLVSGTQNINK